MAVTGPTGIPLAPVLSAYQRTSVSLSASETRLSSGLRLLHTGDDTASAMAATSLQSENSTLRSSLQNGAHATTLLQIANQGLSEIRTILSGMRDLADTANTDGLTHTQYALLDGQFQQLKAGIDRIVSGSNYNGANLLDGTYTGSGAADFQLGSVSGSTLAITIPSMASSSLFTASVSLGTAASAATATVHVSSAQQMVNEAIAKVAAYQERLDEAEAVTRVAISDITKSTDRLLATDNDAESAQLHSTALKQHTASVLFAQALGVDSRLLSLIH